MSVSLNKRKQDYQVNVSRFLALCSRNYFNILRWLPANCEQGECWQVEGDFGCLEVRLLENTQYTQLVEISRTLDMVQYVDTPKVVVRVYHDAKLAEVLTSRQIYRLRPVYDYPNIRMYHRDEKYQVNAFLEELLMIDNHARVICQSES
ncbi:MULTISPECIES: DUF1249 domain-containing protein [Shewanella]|uniref:DUF1249 domain-containing protein n=1 Tax=Shewanella marisflavi TaxID=260364 RepID=A0AAC9TY23_9GAMM|nr:MULTISPECIES: DUF1249 domain-containing protein [Shewanella]ASJ95564.1 hypothetical protein CFF01_02615 [Shewanella marisflavi]MCL1041536.1 DUF1249 domain-containing protein [Shewanella marisflavi]QDF74122.1 DUF1249 domain-containing protein [Shewanella marisflavi]